LLWVSVKVLETSDELVLVGSDCSFVSDTPSPLANRRQFMNESEDQMMWYDTYVPNKSLMSPGFTGSKPKKYHHPFFSKTGKGGFLRRSKSLGFSLGLRFVNISPKEMALSVK
jgi:hypothetical protein